MGRGAHARPGSTLAIPADATVDSPLSREPTEPSRLTRLDSLTGLRASAAFAVFLAHGVGFLSGASKQAVTTLSSQGAAGVTFFFVLSGFVLMWSRRPSDTAASFYRRRFARIYPAYVVSLMGGMLLSRRLHTPLDAEHSVPPVFLLQSRIPDRDYYFAINGVAWSLSCEAFFYLSFPLYASRLFGIALSIRRALSAGLVVFMFGVAASARAEPTGFTGWLMQHAPPVRAAEFLLGALFAVEVIEGTWPRIAWRPALTIAAAAYVLGGRIPTPFGINTFPSRPVHGADRCGGSRRAGTASDSLQQARSCPPRGDLLLLLPRAYAAGCIHRPAGASCRPDRRLLRRTRCGRHRRTALARDDRATVRTSPARLKPTLRSGYDRGSLMTSTVGGQPSAVSHGRLAPPPSGPVRWVRVRSPVALLGRGISARRTPLC